MAKTKMKTCKHCGAQIAKSAKVCPVCGGKNKKPIYKRVWFWLLVLVVIVGIGGAASHKPSEEATKMSEEDFKAACQEVEYKDLMRNIDDKVGDKVVMTGKVNQVIYESDSGDSPSQYKVAVTYDADTDWYDDDIVLYFTRGDSPKLLEDDVITLYGEVTGSESYTTVLGANVTVPAITGVYVTIND